MRRARARVTRRAWWCVHGCRLDDLESGDVVGLDGRTAAETILDGAPTRSLAAFWIMWLTSLRAAAIARGYWRA